MLEFIRNNAQSWGVKALFAIIVLVFVFWGVGSFRGSQKQVLATIGEHQIGLKEFYQTYQRQVESLRQQRGDISTQELQSMDFKRQVFQQMVNDILIRNKAREVGLVVGSNQVRAEIRGMDVFHGDNATFDPKRYQTLLQMNRLTPAQFEADVRSNLVSNALREAVVSSVRVEESEAKELFHYVQSKATIDTVRFPAQDYMDQVQVDDEAVTKYYQEHKQEYKVPAKMRMQALLLSPQSLASSQEVSQEEIKTYYQEHTEQFQRPEQVQARHILIQVGENAPEAEVTQANQTIHNLAQRIEQGQDFAQLAKEASEGPSASKGGDLGWFSRGSMVKSFEDVAFSLQPEEVSDPVRTRFGFHLIQVTGHREAGVKPLPKVKEEITTSIGEDKARDVLEDSLDQVLQVVLSSGDLKKAAQTVGLEVESYGPFSRNNPPSKLNLDQEQVQKLMDMQVDEVTDTPFLLEDGYLLAKKTDHKAAYIPELDQVREQVVSALQTQQAMQAAKKAAAESLQKLKQQTGPADLGLEVKTSQPFGRRGFIPGLGMNQELAQAAFEADPGQWLNKPFQLNKAYVLARLQDLTPPEDEAWEEQKSYWMDNVQRVRQQALFQAYVQGLREAAEISIQAPDALQYS